MTATTQQSNLKIVQDLYGAFGRGDIPAVLNMLTDDVQWSITGPKETSYAGQWHGKARVIEFFKALGGTIEIQEFEPKEFIAEGDHVVVISRERMRVRATGQVADQEWVMVFTLQNGRITRFREFDDTAAVATGFRHS